MTPAVPGLGHPGRQVFQLPGIVVAPLAGLFFGAVGDCFFVVL
jgi:hypothetical protein